MTIKDNGKGFPADRVLHTKKSKRLGLLGMRERLEMVGGNFTVTSTPGKGTTVIAQIPLVDRRAGEVMAETPDTRLTLVTCYPFNYIGAAPKRFIARARQVSPQASPPSTVE